MLSLLVPRQPRKQEGFPYSVPPAHLRNIGLRLLLGMKLALACSYEFLNPIYMISCVNFLRIQLCRLDAVAAFLREVEVREEG
jgi:hypothetical protein